MKKLPARSGRFKKICYLCGRNHICSPINSSFSLMYNGKIVVYTSGTFDMFHSNHLKMIKYARGLGDTLIVGVSTDELVCSYKRPPIIPFEERIAIVKALKYPDIVIPQRSLDHTDMVWSNALYQEAHTQIRSLMFCPMNRFRGSGSTD